MVSLQPGVYAQADRCANSPMIGFKFLDGGKTSEHEAQAWMCIPSIEVLPDGTLQVNATWYFDYPNGGFNTTRINQNGEYRNTSLVDNLGNIYQPVSLSGAARDSGAFGKGERTLLSGWYIFPAPAAGATTFTLYTVGQQVSIPNLILR
jgi:hypothetical protein